MTSPQVLMNTYQRLPVSFARGEGCYLFDAAGNKYLDAVSGVAVCSLGHSHPGFARAIAQQAATLVHTSNLYGIPLQEELAQRLCQAAGMDRAFFCNSGAEANEAAIKMARIYGHGRGIAAPAILVMEGAFHGRTMGALSATHGLRHQQGFAPFLEGFARVPYDDVEAAEQAISANPDLAAVLVEPVQGESGVRLSSTGYLNELKRLCEAHELLLMLDEVQTGNGRCGKYFAFQHSGIRPDVLATAKGLGNGFPIGACLASGKAADLFQPGHHATTFGGSPLACAAALAVNHAIIAENLMENAAAMGQRLVRGLRENLRRCERVVEVRGLGLLAGIELDAPGGALVDQALQAGLLINVAAGKVVRLTPPLNIAAAEIDLIIEIVSRLARDFEP